MGRRTLHQRTQEVPGMRMCERHRTAQDQLWEKRHSLFRVGVARLMVAIPVLHWKTEPTKRSQEVEKVCCPDISKPCLKLTVPLD
ncbi:hypothetical protein Cadr_000019337 [Camelus dromedarius]|uniref:Uncharacterized protein n=1 Tax=Camelus dromedarius TaxID=9838 RepID=A0A5N4D3C6_CAMDR|nr:hypothetical protein Cadr_000019337 [Camelus dromedarius]